VARVFLSYAREDSEAARQLADSIERAGHAVWWDRHLQGGARFASEIERELKNCDAVVVLWSKTSAESAWVQDEAAEGRDSGRLVPVLIGSGKPPLGFRQFQSIDLGKWDGDGEPPALGDLINSIAQKTGGQMPASAASEPAPRTASEPGKATVCVLPFANMSGDPEQEYFSDGITEDIITDLSKVSALSVVARNTAFMFKGQSVDVREIARKLGVDHVLEGSVRKAGNRVRITAQLIDGKAGDHRWADRYDRDLTDIFAIQDEISKAIVHALRRKLLPEEAQAIESRGTENAEAYNLYLMARQQWLGGTLGTSRREEAIVRICRQTVALDPNYAGAWALMALAQAELRFWHGTDDDPLPAAERALALDPDIAEAHCVKARHLENHGQPEAADEELKEAIRLAPDSWEVNREAATLMYRRGRVPESSRFHEKAAALMDNDFQTTSMLMSCYVAMGDEDAALAAAKQTVVRAEAAIAKDPTNGAALAAIATALVMFGEMDRAKAWIERALLLDPDNISAIYNLACGLTFRNADLDGAMDLLEQWFARLDSPAFLLHAEIDPDIDPVRDHPRYQAMLNSARTRLGLPAAKDAQR
jgi:adenylate cyclase